MNSTVPRVVVLLATFNGIAFIAEQVDSIRRQVCCNVDIWASDDQSTDGTWEWLCERSKSDPHIILLPRTGRFGNAAKNFYRLLRDVDFSGYDYVALSDQDDIWFSDKLAVSLSPIRDGQALAVSSNVIAMWPNGTETLIRKSQQQRRLDFMFESAGPGCTYVLAIQCAMSFRQFLMEHRPGVDEVQFHDWMLYAWVRSRGDPWHIESTPTMYYRQHEKKRVWRQRGLDGFAKAHLSGAFRVVSRSDLADIPTGSRRSIFHRRVRSNRSFGQQPIYILAVETGCECF